MRQEISRKSAFRQPELSEYIFGLVIAVVCSSFLIFYLVDLRNIFGWRDALFQISPAYFFFTYVPFFFQHWGRNSGLAELFQWLSLGGAALVMAITAGMVYRSRQKEFMFLSILSAAFILMLLEDAGNIRHTLMGYVQAFFDEPDQGIMGTGFELAYFIVLASVPIYALARYGKVLKDFGKAKIYIFIGFISYFLAASMSFIGTAFEGLIDKNLYTIAGEKLYSLAITLGDAGVSERWQYWEQRSSSFDIGFFLMDSLIEENIELIGAGAFLAAAVSLFIRIKNDYGRDVKRQKP